MPTIKYGDGKTEFGPGVLIKLSGEDLARAIDVYLHSQGYIVRGPRTISYKGELLNNSCKVYVDPSGFVVFEGERWSGRGEEFEKSHKRCISCGHYSPK